MNRLYRSRTDRMLAGVCGGLAKYFNVDSTLIRLALVLLIVLGGSGILAYIVAWILIPEEPSVGDVGYGSDPTAKGSSASEGFAGNADSNEGSGVDLNKNV